MFPVHALEGCVWGLSLATRHTRARTAWSQSLKKQIFRDSIVVRAGVAPASGRPVRKAGSVCAKVELEVGGCCPGQMGEKHWGVRACTLWKRSTVSHQKHGWSTQRDPGPKRRGQGSRKGRECCSSTAGQAPGQGTAGRALLASGACHPAWSNCNMPLQQGESVR